MKIPVGIALAGVCLGAQMMLAGASTAPTVGAATAPEVRVRIPGAGNIVSTATARGEVRVVQFLFTDCVHCQRTAAMLARLQRELGGRGLRVIGAAFNDAARSGPVIDEFVKANGVGFPVGYIERDEVLRLLEIPMVSRFVVPQILVIGRDGKMRAKSEPMGTPELLDEDAMRRLLVRLLSEKAAAAAR